MYFKYSSEFLKTRSDAFIRDVFFIKERDLSEARQNIYQFIQKPEKDFEIYQHHILLCSFCRNIGHSWIPIERGIPLYCVFCGRCSPIISLNNNLKKAENLFKLASLRSEMLSDEVRRALLEQCIVAIITGIEIMFREIYCLVQDHKHVIFGEEKRELQKVNNEAES